MPLLLVGVANKLLTVWIPQVYGTEHRFDPAVIGSAPEVVQEISRVAAIWAVEGALLLGIFSVLLFAWKPVLASFAEGTKTAIGGALLASMNTASEYGFGAVIAALPGFLVVASALSAIPDPLVNEAVTVTALAAMSETFIANAHAAGIPMEVLHRIAAMASGGMDTLPHNGAVITLLAVTGLTHRQAYKDIFAITLIKTLAVFFVIALFYLTGWV